MKKYNPLNLNKKKVIGILVDMVLDYQDTIYLLENHTYDQAQKVVKKHIEHLLGDWDD